MQKKGFTIRYILLLLLLLFLGCNSSTTTNSSYELNNTVSKDIKEQNRSSKLNFVNIYFSKNSGEFSGGVDEAIIKDINSAKSSIKLAIYSLTNLKIADAIIGAYNRGLDVEVVIESDNIDDKGFKKLQEAGIVLFKDNDNNSLMHNKFLIIDNSFIWSGSGNYNYYSFYRNYENFIKINKSIIAKEYSEEFEELKSGAKESGIYFGKYIDVYFSPEDNFKRKVIELINKATKSIEFMIFSFSDKEIADALIEAKNRGVDVKGIFEKSWSKNIYSKDEYLQSRDINISYSSKRLLHNKVMIIDENITITGSYNFTISANQNNRENSIIIKSNQIAKKYILEFKRIYKEE